MEGGGFATGELLRLVHARATAWAGPRLFRRGVGRENTRAAQRRWSSRGSPAIRHRALLGARPRPSCTTVASSSASRAGSLFRGAWLSARMGRFTSPSTCLTRRAHHQVNGHASLMLRAPRWQGTNRDRLRLGLSLGVCFCAARWLKVRGLPGLCMMGHVKVMCAALARLALCPESCT